MMSLYFIYGSENKVYTAPMEEIYKAKNLAACTGSASTWGCELPRRLQELRRPRGLLITPLPAQVI